jgi:hypothetical protein
MQGACPEEFGRMIMDTESKQMTQKEFEVYWESQKELTEPEISLKYIEDIVVSQCGDALNDWLLNNAPEEIWYLNAAVGSGLMILLEAAKNNGKITKMANDKLPELVSDSLKYLTKVERL